MKKYLIILLILSMCGGATESNSAPSEKDIIISNDSMPENQKEAQEDFQESQENNTQTAPPLPSVNFDIVEIYNTKLISDIWGDDYNSQYN